MHQAASEAGGEAPAKNPAWTLFPPGSCGTWSASPRTQVAWRLLHGRDDHAVRLALGAVVVEARNRVMLPAHELPPALARRYGGRSAWLLGAPLSNCPGLALTVQPGVAAHQRRTFRKRDVASLQNDLGARGVVMTPGIVSTGVVHSSGGPHLASTFAHPDRRELDLLIRDFDRNEAASGRAHADRTPGRGLAILRRSRPTSRRAWTPRRCRRASEVSAPAPARSGQRLGQHRATAGPEHVRRIIPAYSGSASIRHTHWVLSSAAMPRSDCR